MVTVNHNVNDCAHVLVVSFHIALEQFINCYKLFVSSFLVVFIYLFFRLRIVVLLCSWSV